MNKIILLLDSFKGSISSKEISQIGYSVLNGKFDGDVLPFSIADGGEGTTDFFINEIGYLPVSTKTVNAFLEPITTRYGVLNGTCVFDVASCVGFAVNEGLNITKATSYGIGLVLNEIISKGYKKIYLGLGGSITNDGGIGILEAMGAKFYFNNTEIKLHLDIFQEFDRCDLSLVLEKLQGVEIIGLCDVNNPLLGPNGASFVYGPQKGGNLETLTLLDGVLKNLSSCFEIDSLYPGSGAAGGIGYCLRLLNGKLQSGIKSIIDELKIESLLDQNTILITGEGALDNTSFQGKIVGYLKDLTSKYHNRLLIVCGINKTTFKEDVYPLHEELVSTYKETVRDDLRQIFNKILRDLA